MNSNDYCFNPMKRLVPVGSRPAGNPKREEERKLLEAEMEGIRRPSTPFSFKDALPPHADAFAASRAIREEWERANPQKAVRWVQISQRLAEIDRQDHEERQAAADGAKFQDLLAFVVGERNADLVLSGMRETEATRAVARHSREEKTFLVLMGGWGAGKSAAAAQAAANALKNRRSVVFLRAAECARLSLFDKDDVRTIRAMRTCGLLVLDDLGGESYHDTWRATFEEVIDVRYQGRQPTVLTTNLNMEKFKQRYGERVADRIRHDGIAQICAEESLRRHEVRVIGHQSMSDQ